MHGYCAMDTSRPFNDEWWQNTASIEYANTRYAVGIVFSQCILSAFAYDSEQKEKERKTSEKKNVFEPMNENIQKTYFSRIHFIWDKLYLNFYNS